MTARSQQGYRANLSGGCVQNRIRSSPPPPDGAAPGSRDLSPMSQDSRLAAGSFDRRGALGGTTPAMNRHGCRTALIGSGAHTRVRIPPPLPPGATRGSWDSRAVCPPPRQRATGLQRNQRCSDFTEVEPVQAEVPLEHNAPNRGSCTVGPRGDLRHPDIGPTLGRATNGVVAPLRSSTVAGTATDARWPAVTRVPTESLTSTRTRARTQMATRAGTRTSDGGEGRQVFNERLREVSPQ